jgi:hypothetical protein
MLTMKGGRHGSRGGLHTAVEMRLMSELPTSQPWPLSR